MADLTKNAILVTVRDRAKWTKIWDQKPQESQITNIFKKNQNFVTKIKNGRLDKKCYLSNGERQSKTDQNLGSPGLEESHNKYFQKFKII